MQKKSIKAINPDVLILVDYPAFNLKIAQYAKKINIPVFWFIAPQVWAWKKNRIKIMRKCIDKLFVALPFELEYFSKEKIKTYYFGHPLLDIISKQNDTQKLGKPIIVLMPGSRKQEVQIILPVMLKIISHFSSYRFVVICAKSINRSFYENIVFNYNVELKFDKTILPSAKAALVASGTATLELAILNIPQVVCYKLNPISYFLAKLFARIKYISLVNILANKTVVKELIQNDFTPHNLKKELNFILSTETKKQIIINYKDVVEKLGELGSFDKISQKIYSSLS